MYNSLDYIRRGMRFANNQLFPSRKRLSSIYFYTTTLCDSQCKHCLIWQKRPVVSMSKNKMVEVMQSRCITKNTTVGLEGGEFLLHPEGMDILKWFSDNHANYDLLSNALKPDKVFEAVKLYHPRRLYISLDGDKDTYEYMRGKDGYDKVIYAVEKCKGIVPISLMFTLSPYNSFEDMDYVIRIAQKYDIDIRIGIYNNISFFDTRDRAHSKDPNLSIPSEEQKNRNFSACIPAIAKDTSENYDFLVLYDEWKKGHLKMKCHSIRDSLVILPNGDIPLCQNHDIKIGNVYEKSLDEIFNSAETIEKHKYYTHNCNQCWINFHRKYDIVLLRSFEKFLPKNIIQLFYGKYRWNDDSHTTYKKFMKNI